MSIFYRLWCFDIRMFCVANVWIKSREGGRADAGVVIGDCSSYGSRSCYPLGRLFSIKNEGINHEDELPC